MSIVGLEPPTIRIIASLSNHYTNIIYWKSKNKKFTFFANGIYVLTKDNRYYLQHVGF